jgi:hypothetical protein
MSEVIQELETRRWQAMIDADLAALDELLHPNLRYTHSTAAVDSKESYMKAIERGVFDYREVDNSEVEIQTFDGLALVNGTAEIKVVAREKEFLLRSRYTCVWLEGSEGWQFLAWQNTPVAS